MQTPDVAQRKVTFYVDIDGPFCEDDTPEDEIADWIKSIRALLPGNIHIIEHEVERG